MHNQGHSQVFDVKLVVHCTTMLDLELTLEVTHKSLLLPQFHSNAHKHNPSFFPCKQMR